MSLALHADTCVGFHASPEPSAEPAVCSAPADSACSVRLRLQNEVEVQLSHHECLKWGAHQSV